MLRKPAFWILFAALSAAAAIFTFENFSTAFPLVSIDLKMDREAALRTARSLAERGAWPPDGFDQAAEFSADQEVQNFIELEGGGKPELGRVIKEKIFAPYTWRVRHFKEADAHETLVRFTPEGEPYGFRVKLPDQEAGSSMAAEEVRPIAEMTAQRDWQVNFGPYRLVESSKELRPGGRTDHTFVYERQDERLGEGRYRLRLVVGGDKLTELTHFVQIPEAFTRRYEQMRTANDAITIFSSVVVFALYILGFCGIGLFFMMRQRWVLWRQPAVWGVFIALLVGLQQLNTWPLLWMSYDTAVSASGFAVRQILTAAAMFAGFGVLFSVSFMAAETLSRRAFPHQAQLWKVWPAPASASKTVFGQTLTGYLLVAPFFAYEIVLYFFAQEKLGWWTPSDTLVNPNMFANYVPSLSAIALSAQAGFWEECLFRAAPLATAALIGDRFGKRRAFIAGAMILQAVVFAAGHAGYANQPAYARVVELIIPSFAFGALYLAFGLLPGIVLHYAYDAVWMSLPLFVSTGVRAHIEQAIVIALVLGPLWVVFAGRLRMGRWIELPEEALNGAWKPREVQEVRPPEVEAIPAPVAISPRVSRLLPVAGLLGLIAWAGASRFNTDAPAISITRSEAERAARQALADGGIELDASWTVMGRVEGQPAEQDRFVWQKAGSDRYKQLLGTYLTPPRWFIRFARFQGDVAERAEEYQVLVDGNGQAFRISHDLPEARPGKSLSADEARTIARAALAGNFQIPLESVKEISAEASKRPARTDWTFVFSDTRDYGLPEGEPRISVAMAGDEVVDARRYIYVPEEWSRNERRERNLPAIAGAACTVALVAIALGGAVLAVIRWSRKQSFSARNFFVFFGVVFLIAVTNTLNSLPAVASQFSTAQPLGLQIGIVAAAALVSAAFVASALGLVGGLVTAAREFGSSLGAGQSIWIGASLGATMAGAASIARQALPSTSPVWGNFGAASTWAPAAGAALSPLNSFFIQTLLLSLVLYALVRRGRGWPLLIIVGMLFAGLSIETMTSWLILGATTGTVLAVAHVLFLKYQPGLIIPAMATLAVLSAIRDGIQLVYPLALVGAIAGALLIVIAVRIWPFGRQNL